MRPVRVLSTLALAGVLDRLRPLLPEVDLQLAPTAVLLGRIAAGERGDVAILTVEAVADLAAAGTLVASSRIDLARSSVGMAVRQGAPRPDISTPAAVAAALLGARSVALSRAGASGAFMAGLLVRLGIADAVNHRATFIPSGFTGERVMTGEADLAVQQVSELMMVPGLDIVGPLPSELGGVSTFTAALFAGAGPGAASVLATLCRAGDLMQEAGLAACDLVRSEGRDPARAAT